MMVCRNPELARRRAHKREDLLLATERDLATIRDRVQRARAPLQGKAEIGLKVGEVLHRHKMAKHFDLTIGDASFSFR
ncbi:IS1634 family transposase, partial [Paramagnetospirillum kuznetsovii]